MTAGITALDIMADSTTSEPVFLMMVTETAASLGTSTTEGPASLAWGSHTTAELLNMWALNVSAASESNETFSSDADVSIASLAIFFLVIGVAGSALSLLYFFKKERLTLPSFLYILISSFDICISIIAVPVVVSLLNSRRKGLFENETLCAAWVPIFYFLKRMSMFLVMMISLTRSIVTASPFVQIRIKNVAVVTIIYGAILVVVDVVYQSIGVFKTQYRRKECSCEIYFTPDRSTEAASKAYSILLQTELIFPCIVVFISLILSLTCLVKEKTEFKREDTKKFRQVSITITIFAGVFLICNVPAFLLQLRYLTFYIKGFDEVKEISSGRFMEWYGHLLSHIFLTLFNTALNPCLYLLRMPFFRQWLVLMAKDPAMLFRKGRVIKRSATSSLSSRYSSKSSRFSSGSSRSTQVGSTVGK